MAIVGHGDDVAVVGRGDGGNAVGNARFCFEDVHLWFRFFNGRAQRNLEVAQHDAIVDSVERETG